MLKSFVLMTTCLLIGIGVGYASHDVVSQYIPQNLPYTPSFGLD